MAQRGHRGRIVHPVGFLQIGRAEAARGPLQMVSAAALDHVEASMWPRSCQLSPKRWVKMVGISSPTKVTMSGASLRTERCIRTYSTCSPTNSRTLRPSSSRPDYRRR